MTEVNPPLTAEEAYERRKAERRLQLMAINEEIATNAESADTDRLRKTYSDWYRDLIGVRPEQRRAFRDALHERVNVSVDELVELFTTD